MTEASPAPPAQDSFVARLRQGADWYGPARRAWRPWIQVVLPIALLLLAAVVGVNVAVNPRADFDHRLYKPLVGDDPLEKAHAYQALATPPERLVLGTSRAALVPPANATATGFNFAIPGGGLKDERIVYSYVRQDQGAPSVVVLGFDSFQLSGEDIRDVAIARSKAADELMGDERGWREMAELLVGTLDLGYSRDTVRSLELAHVTGYPEARRTTAPDGVQVWTGVERERAEGRYDEARAVEANWATALADRYDVPPDPDPEAVGIATDLLATMKADGVRVQVVLLPFHPDVQERLAATRGFPGLQEAALRIALDACGSGLEVYDYSDPSRVGLRPDEFYDATHLAPEGGAKVAAALEAGEGDLCGGGP